MSKKDMTQKQKNISYEKPVNDQRGRHTPLLTLTGFSLEKRRMWAKKNQDKIKQGAWLLCHNCNVALGMFEDDIKLLKKAITYLQKHL